MVKLLHTTLLGRGYLESIIDPIFFEAATKLEHKNTTPPKKNEPIPIRDGTRIFFHIQYHKRDVSRQVIRDSYETICESLDENGHSFKHQPTLLGNNFKISKTTIAYSRPKNLRDKLQPSKLFETTSCNVQHILHNKKQKH